MEPLPSWLGRHQGAVERAFTEALKAAHRAGSDEPLAFIANHLQSGTAAAAACLASQGSACAPIRLPQDEEQQTDKWSVVSWLKFAGVHRVVAGALQAAGGENDEAMLEFLRGLPDRAALEKHICTAAVLSGIVVSAACPSALPPVPAVLHTLLPARARSNPLTGARSHPRVCRTWCGLRCWS